MESISLLELIACPTCQSKLNKPATAANKSQDKLHCSACSMDFPYLDGMPWLFNDPEASLAAWNNRLKYLLQHLHHEAEQLKEDIKYASSLAAKNNAINTWQELRLKRLRKLLQAKVEHRKTLQELLEPLGLSDHGSLELSRALKSQLPPTQTLTGYYANAHRDWGWDETSENSASLSCLERVIGTKKSLGRVLVLGAGFCRLAYDLHQSYQPEITVAVDINPLALIIARRMLRGRSIKMYEFPIAPRDLEHTAVLRRLAAPETLKNNFELVFSDAMLPAFQAESFDTIVTPWLIDIMPQPLEDFVPVIYDLLKPEGRWLNFGSLAFDHANKAANYSQEETLSLIEACGLTVEASDSQTIPYMCSPASAHGRQERVFSFSVRKNADVQPQAKARLQAKTLPNWLLDPSKPIPRTPEHQSFTTIHSIYLDVVQLIDGQRSLTEVAQAFAPKYGMSLAEALDAIRTFLSQLQDGST